LPENAPLGVAATRATLRAGLADCVAKATEHELAEQGRLRKTADFKGRPGRGGAPHAQFRRPVEPLSRHARARSRVTAM